MAAFVLLPAPPAFAEALLIQPPEWATQELVDDLWAQAQEIAGETRVVRPVIYFAGPDEQPPADSPLAAHFSGSNVIHVSAMLLAPLQLRVRHRTPGYREWVVGHELLHYAIDESTRPEDQHCRIQRDGLDAALIRHLIARWGAHPFLLVEHERFSSRAEGCR